MSRDEVRKWIVELLKKLDCFETMPNTREDVADQILAIPDIAIVEREAKLPAFARVDVEGKAEVGRYYDGYKDGQEDMLEAGWVKEMKKWGDTF